MHIDHLVVGQGISGTLLSRSLLNAGHTVLVVDNSAPNAASKVASGIINPVTGKRLVRTWLIEQLLPFAKDTYQALESELGLPLLHECSILDMHNSRDARQVFDEKLPAESEYLHTRDDTLCDPYFRFNYGIGKINPCLLIDINSLLASWRQYLKKRDALIGEPFTLDNCIVTTDHVIYKGHTARNIIFCDGAACAENPFFERLPWSKDKGEALIVSIPGLPRDNIYKQGISIVPWQQDLFWVGATHDWKFTDMQPSSSFRKQVEEQLDYWLKLPYKVVDHLVAQRPVNVERRPFIGLHPLHKTVGVFNGMGTKGCSIAPYFAHQFARYLAQGTPLMPEVDIARFSKILSRP